MVELSPRFSITGRPQRPSAFRQREVLHVARADLHDVGVFGHQIDIAIAHDFGDDGKPGGFARLRQQLEPFFFHALKIVRRCARFESAAAQELRAGRRHGLGGFHDLLFALDGTRAGHGDELVAADLGAADADDGALLAELLADELVGRGNPHGLLDAGGRFERFEAGFDISADADDADHDSFLAFDGMHSKAEFLNSFRDMFHFLPGGVGPHRNDHLKPSHKIKKPTLSSGLVILKIRSNQRHYGVGLQNR